MEVTKTSVKELGDSTIRVGEANAYKDLKALERQLEFVELQEE